MFHAKFITVEQFDILFDRYHGYKLHALLSLICMTCYLVVCLDMTICHPRKILMTIVMYVYVLRPLTFLLIVKHVQNKTIYIFICFLMQDTNSLILKPGEHKWLPDSQKIFDELLRRFDAGELRFVSSIYHLRKFLKSIGLQRFPDTGLLEEQYKTTAMFYDESTERAIGLCQFGLSAQGPNG